MSTCTVKTQTSFKLKYKCNKIGTKTILNNCSFFNSSTQSPLKILQIASQVKLSNGWWNFKPSKKWNYLTLNKSIKSWFQINWCLLKTKRQSPTTTYYYINCYCASSKARKQVIKQNKSQNSETNSFIAVNFNIKSFWYIWNLKITWSSFSDAFKTNKFIKFSN